MPVIVDTHVHIYPFYDAVMALQQGTERLRTLAGTDRNGNNATPAFILAERSDCHFFRNACDEPGKMLPGMTVVASPAGNAFRIVADGDLQDAWLFPGRQVNTGERLEVLALLTDAVIPDGIPAAETLERIHAAGGIPVLSWAPGKWWFKRGRLLEALLAPDRGFPVFTGDTALRPRGYPMPELMKRSLHRQGRVLAGSDPLPFRGEERYIGTLATVMDGTLDVSAPADSMGRLLQDTSVQVNTAGCRAGWLTVFIRLLKNEYRRRKPAHNGGC